MASFGRFHFPNLDLALDCEGLRSFAGRKDGFVSNLAIGRSRLVVANGCRLIAPPAPGSGQKICWNKLEYVGISWKSNGAL